MSNYTVEIKKLLIKTLDVNAASPEEALKQIATQYENCDIELTPDDAHEDTHFIVSDQNGNVYITK